MGVLQLRSRVHCWQKGRGNGEATYRFAPWHERSIGRRIRADQRRLIRTSRGGKSMVLGNRTVDSDAVVTAVSNSRTRWQEAWQRFLAAIPVALRERVLGRC